eukprot:4412388-Amphidinium_carterae.1
MPDLEAPTDAMVVADSTTAQRRFLTAPRARKTPKGTNLPCKVPSNTSDVSAKVMKQAPRNAKQTPNQDLAGMRRPKRCDNTAVDIGAKVPMADVTAAPTYSMARLLRITDIGKLSAIGSTVEM